MILGVLFAVIVSALFAVYAVPRKFSKQNAVLYAMWVGLAYFAGSVAVCSVVWGFGLQEQENLLSPWHLLTALRGILWVCGTASFNIAIDKIGLTRFNQWKNFQGPIGTLLMLVFLDEVAGSKVIWLLLGMAAMFISAVLFTVKADSGKQLNTSGILFSLFAAVCFGITAFINKTVTNHGFIYSQLLYHSLSVVVSAAIIFVIQTRKPKEILRFSRENRLPFISGAMFLMATILSIFSYTMIAGSVSWSITQLNAVWTVLIGIFVFKEVSFKKHWLRIITGFVFAIAAIVFLLKVL